MAGADLPAEPPPFQRDLPAPRSWGAVLLVALLVTAAGFGLWELDFRRRGFRPSMPYHAGMWIQRRHELARRPGDQTVFLGASRIMFGVDLDTWEALSGERPLVLAWLGASIRPVLRDLAADESFHGTVICSYTPNFVFAARDDPLGGATWEYVEESRQWGPESRISQVLRVLINNSFACLADGQAPLLLLQRAFAVPDRSRFPGLPEWLYFYDMDEELQVRMLKNVENDSALREGVEKSYDVMLHRSVRFRPDETSLAIAEMAADIKRIVDRGGKAIWVRYPSSGGFLEFERKHFPRQEYWDRLIEACGCRGIHYEDYPEMQSFVPPESSHLSADDAVRFTPVLLDIINRPAD